MSARKLKVGGCDLTEVRRTWDEHPVYLVTREGFEIGEIERYRHEWHTMIPGTNLRREKTHRENRFRIVGGPYRLGDDRLHRTVEDLIRKQTEQSQ